jgi:hypothetical protein
MTGGETLGLLPEAHSIRRQAERLSDLDRDLQHFLTTSNNLRQQAAIRTELLIVVGTSSSESVFPQLVSKLQTLGCGARSTDRLCV